MNAGKARMRLVRALGNQGEGGRRMTEPSSSDEAPEPRYRAFRVHYTHVTLDSHWPLAGGGTLRAVHIEHPLARVEADESSRVPVEAEL